MSLSVRSIEYISSYFSLTCDQKEHSTLLTLKVLGHHYNTRSILSTNAILSQTLPSIFTSQCFNDANLPFSEEVKNTEIGHLFEHILLEYICDEMILRGYSYAECSGVTDWDWTLHEVGTFNITIGIGMHRTTIFLAALQKTINLMNIILASGPTYEVPRFFPVMSPAQTITDRHL